MATTARPEAPTVAASIAPPTPAVVATIPPGQTEFGGEFKRYGGGDTGTESWASIALHASKGLPITAEQYEATGGERFTVALRCSMSSDEPDSMSVTVRQTGGRPPTASTRSLYFDAPQGAGRERCCDFEPTETNEYGDIVSVAYGGSTEVLRGKIEHPSRAYLALHIFADLLADFGKGTLVLDDMRINFTDPNGVLREIADRCAPERLPS